MGCHTSVPEKRGSRQKEDLRRKALASAKGQTDPTSKGTHARSQIPRQDMSGSRETSVGGAGTTGALCERNSTPEAPQAGTTFNLFITLHPMPGTCLVSLGERMNK